MQPKLLTYKDVCLCASDTAMFPGELHPALKAASDLWADAYNAIRYASRLLMYGPPGTGKSSAAIGYAVEGRPVERSFITDQTCWPEVRGHYIDGPSGTVYIHGPAIRAWLAGARYIVDEIDQAGGDCIPGLHGVADDAQVARITLPNGETVTPARGFQFIATTNQDPKSLPDALCDRFVIKKFIPHPDPQMLMSLPAAIQVAAAFALYSSNDDLKLKSLTSRAWVEMGRLMTTHGFDVENVTRLMFGKGGAAIARAINLAASKVSMQAASI